MSTAATSQTIRVTFQRVSLTDNTFYYFEWDALTVNPDVYDRVIKNLEQSTEYENVFVTVSTVTP